MIRTLVRLLTCVAMVCTALLVPVSGTAPTGQAEAADLSYFDAGNIISDAVFFDAYAMGSAEIQQFLDAKGASCVAGEMPCLKDYQQDTVNQAVDSLCDGYVGTPGTATESAASIIAKVGISCGISPRVLLVLLQKEQGLVTGSRRTVSAYTKATGFSCPDTAPCDPAFSGFTSQVYFAARQFQRYKAEAPRYRYQAGRTNTILWHPNAACGTSEVYIANQATAGLYNYTPYRPNGAALAAGYGTGDDCSSYGNRNFWNRFTDWFGSTQSAGAGAIYTKYQSLGGETGSLGNATSGFMCGLRSGGCWATYANGRIYWSPATGAQAVTGDVLTRWGGVGSENGALGYPLTDLLCGLPGGGCYQIFAGGSFYSSPATGLRLLYGDIRAAWQKQGSEYGALGYPTTEENCGLRSGGCWQGFTGGRISWTPATGARILTAGMLTGWLDRGAETGTLGYPVTNAICGLVRSGCYQMFEQGSLYSTPTTGTWSARGSVLAGWQARGAEWSWLGYPTRDERCGMSAGACYQNFEGGRITWSAKTGADALRWPMAEAWDALGAGGGTLGHPLTDTVCGLSRSGCYQVFERGWLYSTPTTGTHFLRGAIKETWAATGLEWGVLGYPTTDERCGLSGGACMQEFEHGHVYWTAGTGAQPIRGPLLDAWLARRATAPSIGYPTGAQRTTSTGAEQSFSGGRLVYKSADGSVTFVPK